MTKTCTSCHVVKSLSDFHRHRSQRLGVRSVCKLCRRAEASVNSARVSAKNRETLLLRHPARALLSACSMCKCAFMPRRKGGSPQKYCSPRCKNKHDNQMGQERHPQRVRQWWERNPGYAHKRALARKLLVMRAYGGARCACCGEVEVEFLSIDHIGGGGGVHRKAIGGIGLYSWLIRNKFPAGFRVLCMNCNFATRHGRECPHARALVASNE